MCKSAWKAVIKEYRETAVTSKMTLRVRFVEQTVEQPENLVSVSHWTEMQILTIKLEKIPGLFDCFCYSLYYSFGIISNDSPWNS